MTESDDRESKPDAPNSDTSKVWLPPRLRDKLDDSSTTTGGDDSDFDFLNKKSSPIGTIITIVVVLAILGGAGWMLRNNSLKAKAAEAKVEADRVAAVVADSLAGVRMQDSLAAVAHADSVAFAALPKAQQKKILAAKAAAAAIAAGGSASTSSAAATPAAATGATPAAHAGADTSAVATAPKEKGPYGIDAGEFLVESRANTVAETLKGTTGLPARVVTRGEGADATYHVMLGSFASRAAAEAKASSLLAKALVEQAGVAALPK